VLKRRARSETRDEGVAPTSAYTPFASSTTTWAEGDTFWNLVDLSCEMVCDHAGWGPIVLDGARSPEPHALYTRRAAGGGRGASVR
jgi:hypothetical protein